MQAVFRFVQRDKRRWARAEQGHRQAQKAQGTVGELRRFQRPAKTLALHHHAKTSAGVVAVKHAAGEGLVKDAHQQQLVADLDDSLKRGCQVGTVAGQHGGAEADLRGAHRRAD